MLFPSIATPISLLSVGLVCLQASASPVSLTERAANIKTLSGQWDTQLVKSGNFLIENNQWGVHTPGATGWQITTVDTTTPNACVWGTTYQFSGAPHSVKSYTNAARTTGLGQKLSAIVSIPTHWVWTYTHASRDLVADVSWDLWLSPSATGKGAAPSSSYEIMVWLSARGGAAPAGTQIATAHIHGMQWKVYLGDVSTWKVYSFVAPKEVQDYKGNLLPFFTYLRQAQGLPDHYFVQAQAGTEPFVGRASLQTSLYTMNVHTR
ncbi:glycoside hydrolase family 12 protein [Geranomyces variabilis]|nr:glycoside hydrolase family 12 protein [Geranomyces variabilis]